MNERHREALIHIIDREKFHASKELSTVHYSIELYNKLERSKPPYFRFTTFGIEYACRKVLDHRNLMDMFEKTIRTDNFIEARYAIPCDILHQDQIGVLVTPPERNYDHLLSSIKSSTMRVNQRILNLTNLVINIPYVGDMYAVEEIIEDPMSFYVGSFNATTFNEWKTCSDQEAAYYVVSRRETNDFQNGSMVHSLEAALSYT